MRTTFSSEEVAELKRNPCVFDCTEKSVYYTIEFKQRALELQTQGVHTKEIDLYPKKWTRGTGAVAFFC